MPEEVIVDFAMDIVSRVIRPKVGSGGNGKEIISPFSFLGVRIDPSYLFILRHIQ